MTGKYRPLYQFLAARGGSEWSATFAEIERVLGFSLPPSAYTYPAWWANNAVGHTHARAWLEAGWETCDLSLRTKSVVFVRTAPTRESRENERHDRVPSTGPSQVARLLDYVFVHAAVIEPDRGADGALLEFMPQSRYERAKTTQLNRYGAGPFCRFAVKNLPPASGVYALAIDAVVAYIGIANDLAQRWGPQGYVTISPRNCYVGGQSTNCKVNSSILRAARDGRRIDLWIHETSEAEPVEARLIHELDPAWNGQKPSTARVWETLAAETVYSDEWLTLEHEHVRLPNGYEILAYNVIVERDFCQIIGITPNFEIPLVRQYKHGAQREVLEFPAGLVDMGEDPSETAVREFREETGYAGDAPVLMGRLLTNPTRSRNWGYHFLIRNAWPADDPAPELTEDIAVEVVPLAEVTRRIQAGAIADVSSLAGYALVRAALPDAPWE